MDRRRRQLLNVKLILWEYTMDMGSTKGMGSNMSMGSTMCMGSTLAKLEE